MGVVDVVVVVTFVEPYLVLEDVVVVVGITEVVAATVVVVVMGVGRDANIDTYCIKSIEIRNSCIVVTTKHMIQIHCGTDAVVTTSASISAAVVVVLVDGNNRVVSSSRADTIFIIIF